MDKPIQVGDLVVVIRQPCCGSILGFTFQVAALGGSEITRCTDCRKELVDGCADTPGDYPGSLKHIPLSWLKRIPPLGELEGEKRDEEIHA